MMDDLVTKAMNEMAAEKMQAAEPDLRASGLVKAYGDRTVVNGMDARSWGSSGQTAQARRRRSTWSSGS